MGIFDDKQYDEMDWLSKAIEPTLSPLNEMLSKLPNEVQFSPQQIMRMVKNTYNVDVDLDAFMSLICQEANLNISTWDDDFKKILKCFDIELTAPIILDFENNRADGGTVTLIKIKSIFEESELQKNMGSKGLHIISNIDDNKVEVARANEIGELLGYDLIRQKRSARQKVITIKNLLTTVFQENKWNIKNVELADKICLWIKLYLEEGNLAALTNFCKFKVMTHDGDPIYSIEEEAL